MQVVADLHLHSKYSRAVSPQMVPGVMAQYAQKKGLDLLSTGDWTHPLWFRELRNALEETSEGIYQLKSQITHSASSVQANPKSQINNNNQTAKAEDSGQARMTKKETNFLLSVEIACIYTQKGKGRRIHNLVFAPSFEVVEKINKEFIGRGYNLSSDGRPIIGLSSKNLLQLLLEIDERCMLIPAHIWTPWFGVYGVASGFNSLEECFEELTPYIYGIETGLSSDPEMNWHIGELDTRSILSFSDAHSPAKMGREATVFELESLTYENVRKAIMRPAQKDSSRPRSNNKVLYTVEFYPEEGKYHYSGHRACNVTMTPEEQRASKGICPVCHRPVTDGVMRRVQEIANSKLQIANSKQNDKGVKWYVDPRKIHPPFVKLVPLNEIIAEAIGSPVGSPKVKVLFDQLCEELGSEIDILLKVPITAFDSLPADRQVAQAKNSAYARIAEGIQKVREGMIEVKPGYDGVYGVVKIWDDNSKIKTQKSKVEEGKRTDTKQLGLLDA